MKIGILASLALSPLAFVFSLIELKVFGTYVISEDVLLKGDTHLPTQLLVLGTDWAVLILVGSIAFLFFFSLARYGLLGAVLRLIIGILALVLGTGTAGLYEYQKYHLFGQWIPLFQTWINFALQGATVLAILVGVGMILFRKGMRERIDGKSDYVAPQYR